MPRTFARHDASSYDRQLRLAASLDGSFVALKNFLRVNLQKPRAMKAFGFPFQKTFYSLSEAVEIGKLAFPKLTANDFLHLGCQKLILFVFVLPRDFTATFSPSASPQRASQEPLASPRFIVVGNNDCLDLQCFELAKTSHFPHVWTYDKYYYPGDAEIKGWWIIKSAVEGEITSISLSHRSLLLPRQQLERAMEIFSADAIDKNNVIALINYHINSLQKNLYEYQNKTSIPYSRERKKTKTSSVTFSKNNPLEITIFDWMTLDQRAAEKYYMRHNGEFNYTEKKVFRSTALSEHDIIQREIRLSGFVGLTEAAEKYQLTENELLETCIKHDLLIVAPIPNNQTIYPFESRQIRFVVHKKNAPQFVVVTQAMLEKIRSKEKVNESTFQMAFTPSIGVLKLISENKPIDQDWKWMAIGNDFSMQEFSLAIGDLFTNEEELSRIFIAESDKETAAPKSQPTTEQIIAVGKESDLIQSSDDDIDILLTMKETCKITNLSRTSIENKGNKDHTRYDDSFPKKKKLTPTPKGRISYSRSAVLAWIKRQDTN